MRSLVVFSDSNIHSAAPELVPTFTEAGFRVEALEIGCDDLNFEFDKARLDDSSAFVAIVNQMNPTLLINIAYLIGLGKEIWVLSNDPAELPSLIRRAPFITLKQVDCTSVLLKQIQARLNIEFPAREILEDLSLLTSWLSEDPGRINSLPSKHFEQVVLSLFMEMGLRYERDPKTPEDDVILCEPKSRSLLLVETKNYLAGRKVGVGAIERSVANAVNYGCDFTVIVSANDFTRTAIEFAKLCAPPVWLLDRTVLEFWLTEKTSPKSKLEQNPSKLFDWFLNRQSEGLTSIKTPSHRGLNFFIKEPPSFPMVDLDGSMKLSSKPLRKQHKVPEVFFSFAKGDGTEELVDHITQFIGYLENRGIRVWHDKPSLRVGTTCEQLDEVAMAVKRATFVLLFLGARPHKSLKSLKTCQTVASELSKTADGKLKTFIIGLDNPWNRLRLPSLFSNTRFINPNENEWQQVVNDLCFRDTENYSLEAE